MIARLRGALVVAALAVAGCTSGGGRLSAERAQHLVLSRIVDEGDALAWAGQVEGEALKLLLDRCARLDLNKLPDPITAGELFRNRWRERGRDVYFDGKLLELKISNAARPGEPPLEASRQWARVGLLYEGLLALADGGLVAFRARLPGEGSEVVLPLIGDAVRLRGLFMKRWAVLDSSGRTYMTIPLLAARVPEKLKGPERVWAQKIEPAKGLLPISEIEAPPVWRRPVVELARNGALRLDGRLVTWRQLEDAIALRAAEVRNPLGDSSLAVVVLADPRISERGRDKIRDLPGSLGAKCVFRIEIVPLR